MEPDEGLARGPTRLTGGVLPAGSAHLVNEVVRAAPEASAEDGSPDGTRIATAGPPRPSGRSSWRTCIGAPIRFQVAPRQAELDATA